MKKLAIGLAMSAVIFGAMAATVLAAPAPNAQCDTGAASGAFLAGSGNYGWLGALGGTPGYHDAVGQDAPATGYNNSHVCGNPQN